MWASCYAYNQLSLYCGVFKLKATKPVPFYNGLFVYFNQVDGTLQSVLYENSIDYAVKFQDLAAHISGNADSSLLRKTDSSG